MSKYPLSKITPLADTSESDEDDPLEEVHKRYQKEIQSLKDAFDSKMAKKVKAHDKAIKGL